MRERAGTPRRRFAGAPPRRLPRARSTLARLARLAPLALLLAATLLTATACGPSAQDEEADRQAIRQLLEAYLPALAQTYATGDVEPLKAFAVPKEVLTVDKKVRELLGDGREVHPVLKNISLERVDFFRYSNAYVSTLEVWDVKVYAAGSDRVLSEQTDQINQVRYQLKRDDQAGWQILYRELAPGSPAG